MSHNDITDDMGADEVGLKVKKLSNRRVMVHDHGIGSMLSELVLNTQAKKKKNL